MENPLSKNQKMLFLLIGLIGGAAVAFYFLYKDNDPLKEKIKDRVDALKDEIKKIGELPEEEINSIITKARKLLDDLESYLK